jgi:hypothetical protein
MSAKWYRGYQIVGRREVYIERISTLVRNYDLGSVIPNLHTEKIRRGQRQFYLFLGFNSEPKGYIPPRILDILNSISIGHPLPETLEYPQIKSMTSAGVDTEHYRRTVTYRPPLVTATEDPFDLGELQSYIDQQPTNESFLALNRLLYWLSATGAGGWPVFRRVSDLLTKEIVGLDARHLFRRLRLLGHVEYATPNGSKWGICPPVLVQATQPNTYFLAGQRTPSLLTDLSKIAEVEHQPQPTGQGPDIIQLRFASETAARQAVNRGSFKLHWGGLTSLRLAEILPDWKEYQTSLDVVSGFVLSNYTLEQWQGETYVEIHFQNQTGLYRLTPREQDTRLSPQSLFYDADTDQWRGGPWYDLRYLALQNAGEPCRVRYHHTRQRLDISANYRWPDLYERALVLASGFLPLPAPDYSWYYFKDISPELAHLLAAKLNVTIEETD